MELRIGNHAKVNILLEEQAFLGVRRVAGKVAEDLRKVLSADAQVVQIGDAADVTAGAPADAVTIVAATQGKSDLAERLSGEIPEIGQIRGGRERYVFLLRQLPGSGRVSLLIVGSDKRGTIYGLFHLSELLHVSPWVYFADVTPVPQEQLLLTDADELVSKEPSVKYRGFFINDEWPAYGNWTFEHFGGFTAEMYDHVFELILRLKGNYLWPAMWTSNFSLDGPGLANAELADEYGIVMSNSHHEPCSRHSEEWDLVRGDDSPYGNAWNFDRNKEGLTNYWRDGLKRNAPFENIITVGMRGERDSEILGRTATLQENIDYLKEVITTQNRLIREIISEDLDEVPRMLAIYKEVEAYFKGDDTAVGLKEWPELDGITCMLCEDNQGNMRLLPEESTRNRKGGWGMYYHFDYHGDPFSYEWIGSTYLPKVWEQMGEAYEAGIREIWIVNVGDLKPQELPLSYFLDLAYDFEKYGTAAPNTTDDYTKRWIAAQFGGVLTEEEQAQTFAAVDAYTWLNSTQKPESLQTDTYHPVHYGESQGVLDYAAPLAEASTRIYEGLKAGPESAKALADAYFQLVTFPVCATLTQHRLMLLAGQNHFLAAQGKPSGNALAVQVAEAKRRETELRDAYHSLCGGKWNGMMLSQHVGFQHWNEEENRYPERRFIWRAEKKRLVVSIPETGQYSMGGDWTRKDLHLTAFCKPGTNEAMIELENAGNEDMTVTVEQSAPWITVGTTELSLAACPDADGTGRADFTDSVARVAITLDRKALREAFVSGTAASSGEVISDRYVRTELIFRTEGRHVKVQIYACSFTPEEEAGNVVPVLPAAWRERASFPDDLGLILEAGSAASYEEGADGAKWVYMAPYGKYDGALKAFPVTEHFSGTAGAPSATYEILLPEEGEYLLTVLSAPSNPTDGSNHLRLGVQLDDREGTSFVDTIPESFRAGVTSNRPWSLGVINQIHLGETSFTASAGKHCLKIFACDPGLVVERLMIRRKDTEWAKGYLGPLPKRLKK
ncbi:MAG: glycosyl hydrolase 115 family protein [Lachnospiraceae bacterium]|nr:glycosyl hydrolase 115 family protein [Lachnospiraceae bacterium]